MDTQKYFKSLGILAYNTFLISFVLPAFHLPHTNIYQSISSIIMVIFIITCLVEVNRSPKFMTSEKVMWTSALIIFNVVSALIYFINGRNKLFRTYRILKR